MLLGVCEIEPIQGLNFRERERRAVHGLVRQMLCDDTIAISHNDEGKPIIPDWNISVSHTRGYAAVVIAKDRRVGVDIEYQSDRVGRIAGRFLRSDELASLKGQEAAQTCSLPPSEAIGRRGKGQENTLNMLKAWCAKEAVFKYYSEDRLLFNDMRCTPVDATHFLVENLKRGEVVRVAFKTTPAYVLAWVE